MSNILMSREEFLANMLESLDKAYDKHGKDQWSRHEFYGILKEEVDEVWDAIKNDEPIENVIEELTQVACVCLRYVETGDRYNFTGVKK